MHKFERSDNLDATETQAPELRRPGLCRSVRAECGQPEERGSGTMSEPKTCTLEAPGAVLCYDVREDGGAGQPVLNQPRA